MKTLRFILPLLVFLVIIMFLWLGLKKGDPHQLPSALIGQHVPLLSAPSLLAESTTLTAGDFQGQPLLLNVWATWCVTCQAEHSVLMDIAATHKVRIFGLNYKDDLPAARQWLKNYGNPYQDVIADPQGRLAIDFGVYGTPETFVIDAQGVIRYKHVGALTWEVWQQELLPVIEKLRS